MNAKPAPTAIEYMPDFMMMAGDDEDWARMERAVIMKRRIRRYDIRINWIELHVYIRVQPASYMDFTAMRLERARVLAQKLQNILNGCIKN